MGLTLFICFFLVQLMLQGQTWSPLQRLTWNSGGSQNPSIAADSASGIYIVWNDTTWGNCEIIYKYSTNSGDAWSNLRRLTWNTGFSNMPDIAVDSAAGVHVVWEDDTPGNSEIFYKRSTDSGSTWSAPIRLTWNTGFSNYPIIAVDSGSGIHVVWRDYSPGNYEIFYKNSTNGGITWSAPKRLTWNTSPSMSPSIAVDSSDNIHVVWRDNLYFDINYRRSTDGGSTWSSRIRLTWNAGLGLPSIVADPGNGIHIICFQTITWFEIYYLRSTNGGTDWLGRKRLTWSNTNSSPSITADSANGIHVVWQGLSPPEIFYKSSTDSGATWSPLTRLTWTMYHSYHPNITSDSANKIHVVWDDLSFGGAEEIFYKKTK